LATNIPHTEIMGLVEYLESDSTESAKRKLVYPLFTKLFGEKFLTESDACGADGYVPGQLIVELKSNTEDWVSGLFQALHYEKREPKFSAICVISNNFLGLWKYRNLPKTVIDIAKKSPPLMSPNEVGRINANQFKKVKGNLNALIDASSFNLLPKDFKGLFAKETFYQEIWAFAQILKNLDKERLQIRYTNFIQFIKRMFRFFDTDIEAIHAFYSLVGYWDVTSKFIEPRESEPELCSITNKYNKQSEFIRIKQSKQHEFKKFVEGHYVHFNDGSGFPIDIYFSRFDEVIYQLKPDYAKQHGIFFTDFHLCKFTRWFIHNYFETRLNEKYIIFDPAGGSGNLVTSWRENTQHKIISELQPDLLKTIEKRMLLDDEERGSYTIIPKTSKGEGLNFLNKSAKDYLQIIQQELKEKNVVIDKPFAFLLNPPYKNTDQNVKERISNEAEYSIHQSIIENIGRDASKERYILFISQILNICKLQVEENKNFEPLIMIFTPTSWLIPKFTYKAFRELFDKYFKYETGYMVTCNEFFKIPGKWPIAFTIWKYKYNNERINKIRIKDFTHLKYADLKQITFMESLEKIRAYLSTFINTAKTVNLSGNKVSIVEWCNQTSYDFKRSPTKVDIQDRSICGGLPLLDERRKNKKTYGDNKGEYIGLMDNQTPCRLKADKGNRVSKKNIVWFRLDSSVSDINKTVCQNAPTPVKSYSAYDLESAKKTFTWFAITKSIIGRYPLMFNQSVLWAPDISKEKEDEFYSLCFTFGLMNNDCVVTRFEKNNPIDNTPEIFLDNPLCPINKQSFWSEVLDKEIKCEDAMVGVETIKQLYNYWDKNFTKGKTKYDECLKDMACFKYFNYEPFLTQFSGLVQIKKYAIKYANIELLQQFERIEKIKKEIKDKIFLLLTKDFKYFE